MPAEAFCRVKSPALASISPFCPRAPQRPSLLPLLFALQLTMIMMAISHPFELQKSW